MNLLSSVRWSLFCDAPSRLCSLVCHVLFPNMSPVGYWFPPRCAPGRGLGLSATMSLWRFWPRFSVWGMSGRRYQIGGGSHCRGKILCVLCKNVYPLSEGCVSWLCRTGFVALRRRMMTKGFPLLLWDPPPGIRPQFLYVWGMYTTYTSLHNAWFHRVGNAVEIVKTVASDDIQEKNFLDGCLMWHYAAVWTWFIVFI